MPIPIPLTERRRLSHPGLSRAHGGMSLRSSPVIKALALLAISPIGLLSACREPAPSPGAPPAALAATSIAPASPAPSAAVIEDMRGKRPVDPAHQRCAADGDCDAVLADCSNLRCIGVRREHAPRYSGLDCKGYTGVVGNYDCQPRFHIEAPRCEAGKCVSRRIE
ncbi:Hypothetical protein A7982_08143 [Minicystis rosea]|nr:Hypothetical protein A7982_08143 [Minicystis rosea]